MLRLACVALSHIDLYCGIVACRPTIVACRPTIVTCRPTIVTGRPTYIEYMFVHVPCALLCGVVACGPIRMCIVGYIPII